MKLQSDQIKALEAAKKNRVFILTGAPGTGKSTVTRQILDYFESKKLRCRLAAPSGKAAKRMFECTGRQATTIHKLLEPQKVNGQFRFTRNHENPIEADLICLDEMSMIDVGMMARFLEAVAPNTRLILVGDTYQLPSVGPGNILKDLIESGVIPCEELTIIKRQDAGEIIRSCHEIKAGRDVIITPDSKDFFFMKIQDEGDIREAILDLVCRRLPAAYKVDPYRDIQVMSPLREKTGLGCKILNLEFQKRLNKNRKHEKSPYKVADKVIQTKNQYDLGIINGDIGYVTVIDMESRKKTVVVEFENPKRTVELPLYQNDLMLAYAVTVHKMQGSEAPIIVMPIHRCFGSRIFQRNLVYTAISRAKTVCVLVGQRKALTQAIRRNEQQKRCTGLAKLLGTKKIWP